MSMQELDTLREQLDELHKKAIENMDKTATQANRSMTMWKNHILDKWPTISAYILKLERHLEADKQLIIQVEDAEEQLKKADALAEAVERVMAYSRGYAKQSPKHKMIVALKAYLEVRNEN